MMMMMMSAECGLHCTMSTSCWRGI